MSVKTGKKEERILSPVKTNGNYYNLYTVMVQDAMVELWPVCFWNMPQNKRKAYFCSGDEQKGHSDNRLDINSC